MNSFTKIHFLLTSALSFSVSTLGSASEHEQRKSPNVIVIVADDLGYGDIGCFGSDLAETPHLDALAAGGIKFTDFHANGTVCSPTRAALMTGRYQQRTGINWVVTAKGHRDTGLNLEEVTLAELAKLADYKTGMIGKWHLGYSPKLNPTKQGFDVYKGFVSGNIDYHAYLDQTGRKDWWVQDQLSEEEGYLTDRISDHSVEFVKQHSEEPFFLYVAHGAPHYPYQGRNSPVLYELGKPRNSKKDIPTDAVYKEMIEAMDQGIGRLVESLKAEGIFENTLIFFLSDNGQTAKIGSAGPLRGHKSVVWEAGHRVPAIAHWPAGIKAEQVSDELVMGADLWPTMAELMGVEKPDELVIDGVSIVDHLQHGKGLKTRPFFLGMRSHNSVRLEQFKLVTDAKFQNPELYDLDKDLAETNNIAGNMPEKVGELTKLLKAWHHDVNAGVEVKAE